MDSSLNSVIFIDSLPLCLLKIFKELMNIQDKNVYNKEEFNYVLGSCVGEENWKFMVI